MKTNLFLVAAAVAVSAVLSSCQSTPPEADSAVICDKCRTLWVRTPVGINISGKTSNPVVFRDHSVMQCPDCEKAYVTFMKTGSLKHRCSHCGGGMFHCTVH